ncbi:hypothetical protein [Burkholderia sp. MBR-1]|uniref:hypothetical protein n=1 Tax=Burkholderia sp. MBR-1 TaxID=2732364 RepID=UPI0015EF18BB|nr:hypothetical protein [Burkholderia sp. MBR-1]QMI49799.1 hypothetical protein MBR110_30480 [Burkholderia sp. MBR-1]
MENAVAISGLSDRVVACVGSAGLAFSGLLSDTVMTLAEHRAVFDTIVDGEIAADTIKHAFERLVRDRDSVKAELRKMTVKELEKIARPNWRGQRKDMLVSSAFSEMLYEYAFIGAAGGCISISGYTEDDRIAGLRGQVVKLTDVDVAACRERHLAAREAQRARLQQVVDAIKDPQTLEDFATYIRYKGAASLTPEQIARRDALIAEKLRVERENDRAARGTVEGVDVGTGLQIVETTHTRDNYPLFVVRLDTRVDRAKYDELLQAARRLGGWYSSFGKNGAVPGFQFREKPAAEQFMGVAQGEAADISGRIAERDAQKKNNAVSRLRDLAANVEDAAQESLTRDRLTNTARRAKHASYAEAQARTSAALARIMVNLANAIEAGQAYHLEHIREKTQVQQLIAALLAARHREINTTSSSYAEELKRREEPLGEATVNYVTFPKYVGYIDDLPRVARDLEKLSGLKLLGRRIAKVAIQHKANESGRVFLHPDLAEACIEKLGSRAGNYLPWYWLNAYDERKRYARMEIKTIEQLRCACREFLQHYMEPDAPDRAVELERELVGWDVGIDFFPTPMSLARRMVEKAGIRHGMKVCEPQAGNGNIATAIREAGVEPDCVEIAQPLRAVLEAKRFKLIGWDFLDIQDVQFDAIVANPPFGRNADIEHTRHAFSLLAEKGCLVTVVGEGAFSRTGAIETEFRAWLDEVGAEIEMLPQGTFMDPSLLATTGANARLVTICR